MSLLSKISKVRFEGQGSPSAGEMEKLQDEMEKLAKRLEEKEGLIEALSNDVTKLEENVKQKDAQLKALQKKLEEVRMGDASHIDILEKRMEALKKENATWKDDLYIERMGCAAQIGELNKEIEGLKAQVSAFEGEKTKLQETWQSKQDYWNANLQAEKKQTIYLEQQLSEAQAKARKYQASHEEAAQQLQQLAGEVKQLK